MTAASIFLICLIAFFSFLVGVEEPSPQSESRSTETIVMLSQAESSSQPSSAPPSSSIPTTIGAWVPVPLVPVTIPASAIFLPLKLVSGIAGSGAPTVLFTDRLFVREIIFFCCFLESPTRSPELLPRAVLAAVRSSRRVLRASLSSSFAVFKSSPACCLALVAALNSFRVSLLSALTVLRSATLSSKTRFASERSFLDCLRSIRRFFRSESVRGSSPLSAAFNRF